MLLALHDNVGHRGLGLLALHDVSFAESLAGLHDPCATQSRELGWASNFNAPVEANLVDKFVFCSSHKTSVLMFMLDKVD